MIIPKCVLIGIKRLERAVERAEVVVTAVSPAETAAGTAVKRRVLVVAEGHLRALTADTIRADALRTRRLFFVTFEFAGTAGEAGQPRC